MFLLSQSRGKKKEKRGDKRDGLNMSLHVSEPTLNYNEGKKRKSPVMASLEYNNIALVYGVERWMGG